MNPLDLVLWSLAAGVGLVITGAASALLILLVRAAMMARLEK